MDLQAQARLLEDDLREQTEAEPEFRDALRAEYGKAVAAERTAAMYETWRDERDVQIAAAWMLACVLDGVGNGEVHGPRHGSCGSARTTG
ncbi:hypothetical protein ACPCSK_09520 [Streptomyces griseoincarnatus]